VAAEPASLRVRPDDPELSGIVRLATAFTGAAASLSLDPDGPGLPLRGMDGQSRGTLSVTRSLDDRQRAALEQLAAQAGALLERREREDGMLDTVGALLRSNDELAGFAGRVAHDLRAPLTAVLGFLALADGPFRGETSERAAECVSSARAAATRMRTLIDDLLGYATFTARLQLAPVELPVLVAAVTHDLRDQLAASGGEIAFAGLSQAHTDATLVRQLLQNLVGNALKHGRPDVAPRIRISAGGGAQRWWLEVADNGPGIPADQRERVFDPFVRLPGTHSGTATPGSGIGLATCARIAEALDGGIAVHEAPGGGAAFRATFPVTGRP
jgi:signal transduction histidine kinase